MGFLFTRRGLGDTPGELVPVRQGIAPGIARQGNDFELRSSIMWDCLDLRAGLISSLPVSAVDRKRSADGLEVFMPTPPKTFSAPGSLIPGGPMARLDEWMYATQHSLDRFGNVFGFIAARDRWARPSRIDLIPTDQVTVRSRQGEVTYRIQGKVYTEWEIWHEKQYLVAGIPVGLSPVGYASLTMQAWSSAMNFAQAWFTNGAIPSAKVTNKQRVLTPAQAQSAKNNMKASLAAGDLLVLGADWDYQMIGVPASEAQFLEAIRATDLDIARFMGVPGDMVEASHQHSGSSITYANISQRNLQFLITKLDPAIRRREAALSTWIPEAQRAVLDTNALLRLDPQTLVEVLLNKVKGRALTPDEWRAMDNRPPLTEADYENFTKLFPVQLDAKKESA